MSDQPLNDESLTRVEDLLMQVDVRADTSEQTKILLACGRAEGRAALQKTLRRWQAGAAALSTLSACMLAALMLRVPEAPSEATSQVVENIVTPPEESSRPPERPRLRIAAEKTLHAATDWSTWVEKTQTRPERTGTEDSISLPQKATLMASSRIDMENFLNE